MKKPIYLLAMVLLVSGCATFAIDSSINQYKSVASKIELGYRKETVLALLLPTQSGLPARASKPPESFIKDGKKIEIYYFRSGRQPDNLTTDDEFTPYVFTDGVLTGIGWTVLGGPKSQGQVIQPAPYIEQKQTTIIH